MPRIRTIKPEFWTDPDILKLSIGARLFYIGLWNFADDNGVVEAEPVSLKAKIFPADNLKIAEYIDELCKIKKVVRYATDGKEYILISNLNKHQVIDRPRKSTLPLPSGKEPAPIVKDIPPAKEKHAKNNGKPKLTDEEWLKMLKASKAYQGIDVERELAKMDAWISTRPGRVKGRQFIVNWLNKIERPVGFKTAGRVEVKHCFVCGRDIPEQQYREHFAGHEKERFTGSGK